MNATNALDRPVMAFLTDFGLDGAAATCRAVMLGICPDAQIVDVSHTVRKFAIRDGAFLLRAALPYFPVGVHVAVVDPGVGTSRRAIGVRTTRGDVLIGPDNGLLLPPAEALGGAEEARELTNRALWLPNTTATFHGRDIFAPTAAHLAAGHAAFDAVGPPIAITDLVALAPSEARTDDGRIDTEITYIDSFGNLRLAGGRAALEAAFGDVADGQSFSATVDDVDIGSVTFVRSFGHVGQGEPVLYVDSSGDLALADNQANLESRIGAESGMSVRLEIN